LIINILKGYLSNATELYGLLTGAVESLISMPVAVCYALAITSIPIISRLKKSGENFDKKTVLTLGLTLTLSVIFGVSVYLFSGFAVKVLYGGLSSENKSLLVKMLKTSSITVISLSFYQSSVAIANALNKFKASLKSGIAGGVIKVIITVILLQNPKINIFGAIYGDIFCYLVASFLNLRYIINNESKTKVEYERNNRCGARG
jgi:stage V sporulation protein B